METQGMELLAITQVKLDSQAKTVLIAFRQYACRLPGLRLCCYMSGKFDFLLHIAVTDMAAFEGLLTEQLGSFPGIGRVETGFVLQSFPVPEDRTGGVYYLMN